MNLINSFTFFKYLNIKSIIILLFLYLFLQLNKDQNYISLYSFLFVNKKRPKISVFIPIFNKENFLHKCIQSLQNQTLKNVEIIAVNENSNDNSLSVLTGLSKMDSRIKIVNNGKNHGLLYSRAMGILHSTGEYLMNLDSDDEIYDNKSLEYLSNQTQQYNVDIITFNVLFKKDNSIHKCINNNEIVIQPKLYKSCFLSNNEPGENLIVNKLIKREIFLRAYETFKIAIYNGKWNYFEDDIWSILVSKYAKSELCLDKLIYIYNYNNNSLMLKFIHLFFKFISKYQHL